ncbi:MAG: FtsH protease activity modulator HflK [Vallitaleaceae bacterium]|jgi:membrane protease subunit HflK|nr:FtsH protease activity modulator HflK [Vallitaleaceae bacterium]
MDEFNGKTVDIEMERIKKIIKKFAGPIIVIALLLVVLFNTVYILEDKEDGVVLRFGEFYDTVEPAGLHVKIPFVDVVNKVDVNIIYNMEYGYRITSEGTEYSEPVSTTIPEESSIIVDAANNNASIALIELIIQYRVVNPVDFLFKVEDVEGTLRLALEDVIRNSVQSYTLDQAKTQKDLIDEDIKPALQKKMDDYESGIEITLVGTQNVQFLPNVETAYQQKENANQYKNAKQEDAERYRNTVIPQAEAEATQLVQSATGYKATVIANANASVAEFNALYEEYVNYPEIFKETYFIDSMTSFITNNTLVVDLTSAGDIYKFYNFDQNEVVKESVTNPVVNNNDTVVE